MGTTDHEARDDGARGIERWKEESKAIERVIEVVLSLGEPQTAGWIADEAHVSEQTTREHLGLLVDLGITTSTSARSVTKYQPDAAYLRYRAVSAAIERHSKDEILDSVEQLKEKVEGIAEDYGVESPDELRALAAHEDVSSDEVKEYRIAASEWESVRRQLDVDEEALERYDEFTRDRQASHA
ncbi:DUF7342 family protein [Halorubrum trueperi]|uniref:ArsR family transcriptional regulator n=1 Tax=Halorubrum trueperi TaxID=2004704 RepID=A0ABD5UJ92_9EURY